MKEIIKILELITKTSSTKQKEQILRDNIDNELLQKVLYYTYNPYLKYKVTDKTISIDNKEEPQSSNIFTLLDLLSTSNINDKLRAEVSAFLNKRDEEEQKLYIGMLTKDLKIKCNTKTINKVWANLIPEFNVMLAEKYWDYQDRVKSVSHTITMKMDGHRCVAIKENGVVSLFTRQGQPYEQMVEIEQMFKELGVDNIVIDGELLVSNYKEIAPKERYKATSKILRTKGEKRGVTLVAFDFIPLSDFKSGGGKLAYSTRRKTLEDLIKDNKPSYMEVVEKLYQGTDTSKIETLLDEVTAKGEEGLMINIDNAPYKLSRTPNILKVKKMLTADVRVIDIYEGEKGKEFEGTLGGVTIEFIHNGEVYSCNCGSGFKVEERDMFWKNPSLIKGKIIEVHYFEVSTNEQGGFGLRFPIFKGIREDKFEISMY